MNIHHRIKTLRKNKGLSMQALGKLVGVEWQAVQLWEKEGGTAPKRTRLEAVAKALETTTDYLINGVTHQGKVTELREAAPPPYIHPSQQIQAIVSLLEQMTDIGIGRVLQVATESAKEHPKQSKQTA